MNLKRIFAFLLVVLMFAAVMPANVFASAAGNRAHGEAPAEEAAPAVPESGTRSGEVVTIGDQEPAEDDSLLPMNSLYEYSYSQQIYTAEEIGYAGAINAVTVWLKGNENLYEMPFDIYMVETDKASFNNGEDWISVNSGDVVYSGSVTVHNTEYEEYTFELDTPFNYSGSGNLVVCFDNNTGSWKGGLNGMVFGSASDPVRSIYARRDSADYDPMNMSGITAYGTAYKRNVIRFDITPSSHIHEFIYHEDGATITAECTAEGCYLVNGLTMTISAPEKLYYNGNPKPATLGGGYSPVAFPAPYTIVYTKAGDPDFTGEPIEVGDYTASITFGDATASVSYTIEQGLPIIELGDPDTAGSDSYLPAYSYYNYSYTQQIYTADEMGMPDGCKITAITFWLKGAADLYEMPFDIYMVETDKETFESTTAWIPVTADDIVYSGAITVHNTDYQEYTFQLTAPFEYSGSGNLVVCFDNNTGNWKSGLNGKVFSSSSGPRAIYKYNDDTNYDPTTMADSSISGSTTYTRNVICLNYEELINDGAVAEVNGVRYTSMDKAVEAANAEGGVLKLLENVVAEDYYWFDDSEVTIDLNGKTLDMGEYNIVAFVDITVTDSSSKANGRITSARPADDEYGLYGTVEVYYGHLLTVENGTIENTVGNAVFVGDTCGSVNINGGTVTGARAAVFFRVEDFDQVGYFAYVSVNGGHVYSEGEYAIGAENEEAITGLYVYGGVIEAPNGSAFYCWDYNADVEAEGGVFIAGTTVFDMVSGDEYEVSLTGGYYSEDVSDYAANYYRAKQDGTNPDYPDFWHVVEVFEARIGDTDYNTLGLAFEAASGMDGAVTVELIDDCTVPYTIDVKGNAITLDLCGMTVTYTGSGVCLNVLSGSNLTVVDSFGGGELSCASGTAISNNGSLTVEGRVAPGEYTWDFEDESEINEWTFVDADGDGFNWMRASVLNAGYVIPAHSGSDCIASQSYDSDAGEALTPDNWAITPALFASDISNGTFSAWVSAQDADWAAEHFGFYVGNSMDPADMVLIEEWDLVAHRASGDWLLYSVDLTGVTGVHPGEIYFAIRHFDCTDMFHIDVDEVTVSGLSSIIEPTITGSIENNGEISLTAGFYSVDPTTMLTEDYKAIVDGANTNHPDYFHVVRAYTIIELDNLTGTVPSATVEGLSFVEHAYGKGENVEFTVANDMACAVGYYGADEVFHRLTATATRADGTYSYSFAMPNEDVRIYVVVKGDITRDGILNLSDRTAVIKIRVGFTLDWVTSFHLIAVDLDDNGTISAVEANRATQAAGGYFTYPW